MHILRPYSGTDELETYGGTQQSAHPPDLDEAYSLRTTGLGY